MKGWSRLFGLALITGLTSSSSLAITPLTGTRIVYDLSTDSAALLIQNNSPNHININTWITDNDNRTIDNFTIHVSNIEMSSKTKSKITLQAKDKKLFSQKQESLYWLNVAEEKNNHTNKITRMKLLVRPQGLAFIDLNKDLIFSEYDKKIMIKNDSTHYITIINLTVNQQERILAEDYIAPFSSIILENSSTQNFLSMNIIQDSGVTLNIKKHL